MGGFFGRGYESVGNFDPATAWLLYMLSSLSFPVAMNRPLFNSSQSKAFDREHAIRCAYRLDMKKAFGCPMQTRDVGAGGKPSRISFTDIAADMIALRDDGQWLRARWGCGPGLRCHVAVCCYSVSERLSRDLKMIRDRSAVDNNVVH